ncbi:hypothetical protein SH668x_001260 [Planctomicrobium sp. SH668]|uniref:hypothetical protein n=1 Tax=Planctomicrobium sp. SH668 TaxID=3448126 RepID=UPI003F5C9F47
MKGIALPESFHNRRLTFVHESDFATVDAGYTTGGTVAAANALNGEATLTTGTTANNEAFVATKKNLLLSPGRPIVFTARVKHADASPDTSAIAVGISDQAGAGLIQNGGLAIKSGGMYGAMFVKYTGSKYWSCVTSAGAAGTTVQTAVLNLVDRNNLSKKEFKPSGSYQTLEIEVIPTYGMFEIAYSIDGVVVAKHGAIDITNATLMAAVLFAKTTTTDAQVLTADYWQIAQKR